MTDLLEDVAGTIRFVPPVRPASATVSWYKAGSSTAEFTSACVIGGDAAGFADMTVTAVNSQTEVVVSSLGSLAAVTKYTEWLYLRAADNWGGPVRLGEFDTATKTLYFASPPPGTIEVGDTIHGLVLSASVGAAYTAERGLYRAIWAVTDQYTADVTNHQTVEYVVRTQFRESVEPADVSAFISVAFPNYETGLTHSDYAQIAEDASQAVRMRIQASNQYPHLIGNPDVFRTVRHQAIRYTLALQNFIPPGYDPAAYQEDATRDFARNMSLVQKSLQWYDADDSGTVGSDEMRSLGTIRAVRK